MFLRYGVNENNALVGIKDVSRGKTHLPQLSSLDMQIYCALFKRVLTNTLYFLEIVAYGQIFHKIGVTCREIEQRVKEVQRYI